MGLHKDLDEGHSISDNDVNFDDEWDDLPHKKRVRRMLEDRLDRQRLKKELEDFDGELEADFDWDELDR